MTNRSILFLIGSYLLVTTKARAISPGATGYNVKDYDAKGDGITLDSKAINNTIDVAAKAGRGTVFLPAGNYLSGSIHLKSNISLYLDQGAVIIATQSEAIQIMTHEDVPLSEVMMRVGMQNPVLLY